MVLEAALGGQAALAEAAALAARVPGMLAGGGASGCRFQTLCQMGSVWVL